MKIEKGERKIMNKKQCPQDDDWKYIPILHGVFSTRTDYDGNTIEKDMIDFYE
jgi:hypothetical protein